ncbi:MAG: hypothetical protein U0P48_09810 [Ancrocorticia sp.]
MSSSSLWGTSATMVSDDDGTCFCYMSSYVPWARDSYAELA